MGSMELQHTKVAFSAAWILAAAVIAIVAGALSVGPAVLFAGFGLVPVLLIWRRWGGPQQTLSESIQEARR